MTDKELSKLRRAELLEMLIAQGKEYAQLQDELKEMRKTLKNRELTIQEAGNIAEASYKLNDVVGSTQRALDQYVQNVQRRIAQQQEESDDAVSKARNYATETVAVAEKRARSLLNAAREQAAQIVSDARIEAERILAQARETADTLQTDAQLEKPEPVIQQMGSTPAAMAKPRGFLKPRG